MTAAQIRIGDATPKGPLKVTGPPSEISFMEFRYYTVDIKVELCWVGAEPANNYECGWVSAAPR